MSKVLFSDSVNWIGLDRYDKKLLNNAQEQIHHALQLIALAGKHLLTTKADDSHTNAAWNESLNSFVGRLIGDKVQVALNVLLFDLFVMDKEGNVINKLDLDNKTVFESFLWLREVLKGAGVNVSTLSLDLHYELPRDFDRSNKFTQMPIEQLKECCFHRTNMNRILKKVKDSYPGSSEIRTWPHHFDHAMIIPIEKNKDGKTISSMSIGYAINDSIVDEPYVYMTKWKKSGERDFSKVPDLQAGKWYPEKLGGAALPFSEIIRSGDQEQISTKFIQRIHEILWEL